MIDIKKLAADVDNVKLEESFIKAGGYTAYRVAKLSIEILEAKGYKGKMPTEQIFYGYAKKGMIDGVPTVKGEDRRYSEEVATAFALKFCKMWLNK